MKLLKRIFKPKWIEIKVPEILKKKEEEEIEKTEEDKEKEEE